jgi:hypothetical protein
MIKLTRVRTFRPRQGDGKEFGIDFISGLKTRTVYTDLLGVDRLEDLLIAKGWQVVPSIFPGGYWSARKTG